MRSGEASETARRVASHRLAFDRVPVTYGNPGAEEQLAHDVTGAGMLTSSDSMVVYLAARTRFFDRVVVDALDRGVAQVVIAAAGYDGRAWRYAKPDVRWFEVDHPDTQLDKRARLRRLAIRTDHVSFVPADFAIHDIADAVRAAGLQPGLASLFLCEGVAVYLERRVLTSLLHQLRELASDGSQLAISLSISSDDAAATARRAAFRNAVAAMGEAVRTVLSTEEVDDLLATTGWRVATANPAASSQRGQPAGLIVLEPTLPRRRQRG